MPARERTELRPREVKFASLVALGFNYSDAYRRAFNARGLEDMTVSNRASRLANRPMIADRVNQARKELKLEELDSVSQVYIDLLKDIASARDAKNWTAIAALTRLRMQAWGMLSETLAIRADERVSDEELLKRLAGRDPTKRALLSAVLGAPDRFKAA